METRGPSITTLPQLVPRSAGFGQPRTECLCRAVRTGAECGEVIDRAQSLRPLIEPTSRALELGVDPGLPFTPAPDVYGMVPLVQKGSFPVRGRCGVPQEEAQLLSFSTRPLAFEETEPIEPEDTEPQPDKGAGCSGARGAQLGTADPLWGGTGSLPSPPVAFRIGARMTE